VSGDVLLARAQFAGHDRDQARGAARSRHEGPEDLVTFTASHLMLDLSALLFHSAELNADFRLGAGNNGKPLLLLSPAADAAAPFQHERFAVYRELSGDDGTAAGKLGQLVVTGERVTGMMTRGSAGGAKLDDSAGCVYAFAASRDDLHPGRGGDQPEGQPDPGADPVPGRPVPGTHPAHPVGGGNLGRPRAAGLPAVAGGSAGLTELTGRGEDFCGCRGAGRGQLEDRGGPAEGLPDGAVLQVSLVVLLPGHLPCLPRSESEASTGPSGNGDWAPQIVRYAQPRLR
jgi:hypothetical protein